MNSKSVSFQLFYLSMYGPHWLLPTTCLMPPWTKRIASMRLIIPLPGVQRSTRVSLECLHVILARPKHPAFQKGLETWVVPLECYDFLGVHGQLGTWLSAKLFHRRLMAQHVPGCCTKFQVLRDQDSKLSPTVAIKNQVKSHQAKQDQLQNLQPKKEKMFPSTHFFWKQNCSKARKQKKY